MAGDILSIPAQGNAYVVKRGDYLRAIAKQAYGDEMAWPRIWDANPQLHSRKPTPLYPNKEDLIYPGDTLFIPPQLPEVPAPPDPGVIVDDTPLPISPPPVRPPRLLPSGAPIIDAEVTLGEQTLHCIEGKFTYGFDTFAPSWMVKVPWDPGRDAVFDRNSKRGSFAPSTIHLMGVLKGTGRLYIRAPTMDTGGITKQLTFYSRTKDLLDSSLTTKMKEYPSTTLKEYVEDCARALGYKVTFQTDTGKPFDSIQWQAGMKIGEVLQNLAAHRGFYVTADTKGDVVVWKMHTRNQSPVALIESGGDLALGFKTTYDDTKRFRSYGTYFHTGGGKTVYSEAVDETIPAAVFREITMSVDKINEDTAETMAAWVMMKLYLQSMEIQIAVKDWLDETDKIWEPQDLVMVRAPVLEIDDPKPFIIRTVDFTWSASGRGCTLHVIPAIDVKGGKLIH
jgi:hypothetical protein